MLLSVAGSAIIARTYMKWVLTGAHNLQLATSMYSCHGVDLPEDVGAKTSLRSRLLRETIIWNTSALGKNIAYTPAAQSNSSCSVNTLQRIRDGPLEKFWGGGGEFWGPRNFFLFSNFLYEFF